LLGCWDEGKELSREDRRRPGSQRTLGGLMARGYPRTKGEKERKDHRPGLTGSGETGGSLLKM